MNIENGHEDILEFRAYEMKKIIKYLNYKVRTQKFTPQFLAYSAELSEKEFADNLSFKPIKHYNYVKFFNSVVSIISKHKEKTKEEVEADLISWINKDKFLTILRVAQEVKWNELNGVEEENTEKVSDEDDETRIELNTLVYELKILSGLDLETVNNYIRPWLNKNRKHGIVFSYYKFRAIRDIIVRLGKGRHKVSFSSFSTSLRESKSLGKYFYKGLPVLAFTNKETFHYIIDRYLTFMKKHYGLDKGKALKMVDDTVDEKRQSYVDDTRETYARYIREDRRNWNDHRERLERIKEKGDVNNKMEAKEYIKPIAEINLNDGVEKAEEVKKDDIMSTSLPEVITEEKEVTIKNDVNENNEKVDQPKDKNKSKEKPSLIEIYKALKIIEKYISCGEVEKREIIKLISNF